MESERNQSMDSSYLSSNYK